MSIKDWKEDDQPREKFYLKGRNAVSDSELLAILLSSGNAEMSALELSKLILSDNDNSLEKLSKLSIKDLMKYKGIGQVKAITISAALEFGNRKNSSPLAEISKITTSKDSFNILKPYFQGLHHEEFFVLLLSQRLKPIKVESLSKGSMSATIVDLKILAKLAVDNLAMSVIVAHNHPSGNLEPSEKDKELTQKIKSALELFDIRLIDHLILSENQYFSFADEGIL